MAPGTPKSVWRMCLGSPGFPDHDPEFRPQLLLVCAGHSGVGHPESLGPPRTVSHPGTLGATHPGPEPSRLSPAAKDRLRPWGVAWLLSPAQKAGLCYLFFFVSLFRPPSFSNLLADLAAPLLCRLWVHCWVGMSHQESRWGSAGPASMDLRNQLSCGSSAAVRLSTRPQPARLPGPWRPLWGRCLRRCASPRGQAQPHSGPPIVQFQWSDTRPCVRPPSLASIMLLLGLSHALMGCQLAFVL